MFPKQNNLNEDFTMVTHKLFDVLPELKNLAEVKILWLIYRETMGYISKDAEGKLNFKQEAKLSIRDIADKLTLNKDTVNRALVSLQEKGFIVNTGSPKRAAYRLRFEGE